MALTEQLAEYVRACFTAIWIETHEQHEAAAAIAQLCQQEQWRLATWNIDQGLRVGGAAVEQSSGDPLAAIRSVNSLATADGTALLVLENFHRFLSSAEIVQALGRFRTSPAASHRWREQQCQQSQHGKHNHQFQQGKASSPIR